MVELKLCELATVIAEHLEAKILEWRVDDWVVLYDGYVHLAPMMYSLRLVRFFEFEENKLMIYLEDED